MKQTQFYIITNFFQAALVGVVVYLSVTLIYVESHLGTIAEQLKNTDSSQVAEEEATSSEKLPEPNPVLVSSQEWSFLWLEGQQPQTEEISTSLSLEVPKSTYNVVTDNKEGCGYVPLTGHYDTSADVDMEGVGISFAPLPPNSDIEKELKDIPLGSKTLQVMVCKNSNYTMTEMN